MKKHIGELRKIVTDKLRGHNGNSYDIPSSDQRSFAERYTVNENGSILSMSYTLLDPVHMNPPFASQII